MKLKSNEVLVVKCVKEDMTAHSGFKYPIKGAVEASDRKEDHMCGQGLHGNIWMSGKYNMFEHGKTIVVIKVNTDHGFVDLGDKVKFRKGQVVFVSKDVHEVYKFISPHLPAGSITNYATQTAGEESTQTAGNWSTQTAGKLSFHCLRGDIHVVRPSEYSLMSIIGYGDKPRMCQFMRGKDYKEGETLHIKDGVMSRYSTTPDSIKKLKAHEVFVFGSNLNGNHAGGAAKTALQWGAIEGRSEGVQGQTYAFPTLGKDMQQIPMDHLQAYRDNLYRYCRENAMQIFLLTKVGCGIAGYKEDEMAALFSDAPANLLKPKGR